jgi:hypothetical protein
MVFGLFFQPFEAAAFQTRAAQALIFPPAYIDAYFCNKDKDLEGLLAKVLRHLRQEIVKFDLSS